MHIEIDEISKEFGMTAALHPVSLADPVGCAGRTSRAVGLGKDHLVAHSGRAGVSDLRARAI